MYTNQVLSFSNDQFNVECIVIKADGNDQLWFNGKEIATAMEYSNTKNDIAYNVGSDDKKKLCELGEQYAADTDWSSRNSIYITESGLYCLAFNSRKPVAVLFKTWTTQEVLPSIRRTGSYTYSPATAVIDAEVATTSTANLTARRPAISNEQDLLQALLEWKSKRFPLIPFFSGIAELQYDNNDRGKGIPDISIPFVHRTHNGIAVIFKLNDDCNDYQKAHVKYLEDDRNYKVLISDDYDHITETLIEFFSNARFICPHCGEGCRRRYAETSCSSTQVEPVVSRPH